MKPYFMHQNLELHHRCESRDPQTYEHLQIKGLYPCGEGAGYAGGIISAAIDGEKCTDDWRHLNQ
jgi:uncharacterized FAD-dependent dehydrogenase